VIDHSLVLRFAAVDAAGNVETPAHSVAFVVDEVSPAVSAVDPADASSDVSLDAQIAVSFSEPIAPASAAGALVLDPPIAGSVVVGESGISLSPAASLQTFRRYTGTVLGTVTDLAGNPLGADHVWSFRTVPPRGSRVSVDTSAAVKSPKMVFWSNGGLALWISNDGNGDVLRYALYAGATQTWSAPLVLAEDVRVFDVALNPAGSDAMVVYEKGYEAWASRLVRATGAWDAPVAIAASSVDDLVIAAGWDGYGVAWDGGSANRFRRYSYAAPGWQPTVDVFTGYTSRVRLAGSGVGYAMGWTVDWPEKSSVTVCFGSGASCTFGAATDLGDPAQRDFWLSLSSLGPTAATGTYLATWAASVPTGHIIKGRVFAGTASTGTWQAEMNVDPTVSGGSESVIATNGTGFAVAWSRNGNLFGATVTKPAASWTSAAPLALESRPGACEAPSIAATGTAYLVGYRCDDAGVFDVRASSFNGSLATPFPAALDTSTDAEHPVVATTPSGARVGWVQRQGGFEQLANRTYASASGFSLLELVTTAPLRGTAEGPPKLASSPLAGEVLVWRQYDGGAFKLMAASGVAGVFSAPVELFPDCDVFDLATNGTTFMVVAKSGQFVYAIERADGAWRTPTSLTAAYVLSGVAIASNGQGYLALTAQYGDGQTTRAESLYAVVHDGSSWGTPQLVETADGSVHTGMPIAAVANGDGYAATWAQYDGVSWSGTLRTEVRVLEGGSWGHAASFATGNSRAALASDGTGYAIFFAGPVRASTFDGAAWSALDTIANVGGNEIAAAGDAGRYAVAWRLGYSGPTSISTMVRRGSSWGAPEVLADGTDLGVPSIAWTAAEDPLVVWSERLGAGLRLRASVLAADGADGPWPVALEERDAWEPFVGADAGRYAIGWLAANAVEPAIADVHFATGF
jgi:hypothetical protein